MADCDTKANNVASTTWEVVDILDDFSRSFPFSGRGHGFDDCKPGPLDKNDSFCSDFTTGFNNHERDRSHRNVKPSRRGQGSIARRKASRQQRLGPQGSPSFPSLASNQFLNDDRLHGELDLKPFGFASTTELEEALQNIEDAVTSKQERSVSFSDDLPEVRTFEREENVDRKFMRSVRLYRDKHSRKRKMMRISGELAFGPGTVEVVLKKRAVKRARLLIA